MQAIWVPHDDTAFQEGTRGRITVYGTLRSELRLALPRALSEDCRDYSVYSALSRNRVTLLHSRS